MNFKDGIPLTWLMIANHVDNVVRLRATMKLTFSLLFSSYLSISFSLSH